jgi:flagellar basal-body rod protein FlgG
VETANLNPVTEMVDMITVMRAYEANQKAIQAQDETLAKAVNEIGRA